MFWDTPILISHSIRMDSMNIGTQRLSFKEIDRWMDGYYSLYSSASQWEGCNLSKTFRFSKKMHFKSETWVCVRNVFYFVTSYIYYHENSKNSQTLQQSGCLEDDTVTYKHTPTTPTESRGRPAVVLRDLRVLGKIMSSSLWPQGTAGNYHDPCSCSAWILSPLRLSGTEKEDLRRVQTFFSSDIWIQGGHIFKATRRLLNKPALCTQLW